MEEYAIEHIETVAIRNGQVRTSENEHNEPIFSTSSYVFDNSAHAAASFLEETPGNIYSRFTNPTVRGFQNRLASLEGGTYCVATSSGMAAITGLVLALLKSGDHIVASTGLFGSTIALFDKIFSRFNIEVTYVSLTDKSAWEAATKPNTRLYFLESPSNPICEIADISEIAHVAKQAGVLLAVDNAFCTPILQRPLEMGADIVVHTATKYLDGQGRCVGGAVVVNDQELHTALYGMLRTTGPSMSPFNAWVFLKGLETLYLRMKQHCENAMKVAQFLSTHPAVQRVYYPGLKSHPQYNLAKNQKVGFGGIVSFEIMGNKEQAWQVIDSTKMLSITANLGDAKTTITHPATTTHARISEGDRQRAGIQQNLIRLSVGLEHVDDIIADLVTGLNLISD